MELAEYDRMNAVEDHMWWYRAAHANVLDALGRSRAPAGSVLLDAGCGTGGLLRRLGAAGTGRLHIGVDILEQAAVMAGRKSGAPVAVASAGQLPFPDDCLGTIVSVDVICHRLVDPHRVVAEALRCLQPGGSLIVNVPAYQWMASFHDRMVHNARRFDRAGLRSLLLGAGFSRVRATYWNSLLFPIMVLRRKLLAPRADTSDVAEYSWIAERIFGAIMGVERAGLRLGLRYPFGGSLLAIATK
ncbi:MAG: class I SAM-dependent methyltransferase [Lautropia sp.]